MNPRKSLPICLRAWGDLALFSRPEFKSERVSYDIITPSAARGIFEAVFWKPQIRWSVTGIDVLKPVRTMAVRRNEVKLKASTAAARSALAGGDYKGPVGINVEESRTQRASLLLRDVDYLLHATLELADPKLPDSQLTKYIQMFQRRAEQGQCFSQPYMGCREFPAFFEFVPHKEIGRFQPLQETRDLGFMLHEVFDRNGQPNPTFYRARMENGRVSVPAVDSDEVLS